MSWHMAWVMMVAPRLALSWRLWMSLMLMSTFCINLYSVVRLFLQPGSTCSKGFVWLPEYPEVSHVDQKLLLIPGITKADAFAGWLGPDRDKAVVKKPVPVLLLSYMRSGSSFVGKLLFDINPDVFYFYEPLASLYASMYGIPGLWTTDTDIVTHRNGSERNLPAWEVNSVAWMLGSIFSCQLDSLPTLMYTDESVAFRPWSSKLAGFRTCLTHTAHIFRTNVSECWDPLKEVCGARFGQVTQQQQEMCWNHMWGKQYEGISRTHTADSLTSHSASAMWKSRSLKSTPEGTVESIREFKDCIHRLDPAIKACGAKFQEHCPTASARVTKTVRATMDAVGPLLEAFPDLHVMHLHRDPRSVVGSRKRILWTQGLYDRGNVSALAAAYCQRLRSDSLKRRALNKRFPGRILEVIFDDFIGDVVQYSATIYQWLGLAGSQIRNDQLRALSKNSKTFIGKWKEDLSAEEARAVLRECRQRQPW